MENVPLVEEEGEPCAEDAKNAASDSRSGGAESGNGTLHALNALVRALHRQTKELRRHNDLMGTLIEQNAVMLESLLQSQEEDDQEPNAYLDGTPIER